MSTYAKTISNKVFTILSTKMASFGFNTFRRSPMLQVMPEQLPMLAVFILKETRKPDGDANHGEPRFVHNLSISIGGAIAATKDTDQFDALEEMMAQIDEVLLTDPTFVALIEGVESMDRQSIFVVQPGETPLAEIQITMVVSYRTYWPPNVTDDYLRLHVKSNYPYDQTVTETDGVHDTVQQVEREYEIPQN